MIHGFWKKYDFISDTLTEIAAWIVSGWIYLLPWVVALTLCQRGHWGWGVLAFTAVNVITTVIKSAWHWDD